MKTIAASFSILFLTLLNGGAMANDLIKTGQWVYLADRVMGGISEGTAQFEDQVIRLSGEVSTANNGGFIQVRSPVLWEAAKGKTGIRLTVKGNGRSVLFAHQEHLHALALALLSPQFSSKRLME
jgi:hypothetical protein